MSKRLTLIRLATAALWAATAWAQTPEDVVKWSAAPAKATVGETFSVRITAKIIEHWHIYSITQADGGPTRTLIELAPKEPFRLAGAIRGPVPKKAYDDGFQMETESYENEAEFTVPLAGIQGAEGRQAVHLNVTFQACNASTCLPPSTLALNAPVVMAAARGGTAPAPSVAEGVQSPVPPAASQPSPEPQRPLQVSPVPADQSWGSFLWLSAVMGALSLLTPCVFPMVPITVSYFTEHGSGTRAGALRQAAVYAAGIVFTFTGFGLALSAVFGAGGVNRLAASPWVNLFITAIFLAFAASLFGAFYIQMPTGLMNRLDGLSRGRESGGIAGPLLMGFTFTLTSFTCTAPFVGSLLVLTAQGNWRWPLTGMLAYSSVFAIPFFGLALAPQLLSRLPRAGGWMNSVKVVMGLLEVAAAMKFLSNADLVWAWGIFTRQTVLAVWIAIGILAVLYVMGYFRMSHDARVESIGVVRLATAAVFLSITIALVPGLFGRPLGELDSFLPPAPPEESSQIADAGPHWILNDYERARQQAAQEKRFVFVDFTGYTCTNCRWMEANMFPRPEIRDELKKMVTLRLFTDGSGSVFSTQQKMQQQMFHTVALPLYVILRPDGTPVATFPGLTRDAGAFLDFLRRGPAGKV
jgi:thiol:disulfide interchange protein